MREMGNHFKTRETEAKEIIGKKVLKGKVYSYTYFTLPLNIYLPKHIVEKYGKKFVLRMNTETGEIYIAPKKLLEDREKERE